VLKEIQNPNYIPNYKYVENSKVLQYAQLDKIIEECDVDR
jgi:hypothetical protein